MIINTDNSVPRKIVEKAISRFRGAYKIPTTPRIRYVDDESVRYDWEAIKAYFFLIINDKGSACAIVTPNQTITPIFFDTPSDEELIIIMVNCFEEWVKYYMRDYG